MSLPIERAKQAVSNVKVRAMSSQVAEVRQHINLIQEAMRATMKKDVHYGTIPGCPKPSLYKPGAELILTLFKLSCNPEIMDMSKDGEIRYQVKANITTRDGVFVGSGIGECSSGEEKYMWRAAVCPEEYDSFPETMRRIKFKKGYNNGPATQAAQVRVNPGDMANTILKMAVKRAMVAACLQTTACSDIFTQDIEDLPEGFIPPEARPEAQAPAPRVVDVDPIPAQHATNDVTADDGWGPVNTAPAPVATPVGPVPPPPGAISEPQRKRLFAVAMGAGMSKDSLNSLVASYGYASSRDILKKDYEEICAKAQSYNPVGA